MFSTKFHLIICFIVAIFAGIDGDYSAMIAWFCAVAAWICCLIAENKKI